MSHVSADLEYFKCDVCGTYFHKDIFVPHRRECNGLNSTELKRSEITALHSALSRDTRVLVTEREKEGAATASSSAIVGTTTVSDDATAACAPQSRTNVLVSTDEMERRQANRVRTDLANRHYDQESEKFRKLAAPARQEELMAFLNA